MAVIVESDAPQALLAKLRVAVQMREIHTWAQDDDGDFTHTPHQWANRAWLRPQVSERQLNFGLIGPTGTEMSIEIYAVYHGRFIELLLAHFDRDFRAVWATANKGPEDLFS